MKIGEALAEKKRLQVRLAKCYELMKKSFYYQGKKPDFSYTKLSEETLSIEQKILDIKVRIQLTNLSIFAKTTNGKISLAELIINLGDIRSRISHLNELYKSADDRRYSEEDAKSQVEPEKIEEEIKKLNKQKTELDSILQHTNWTVDLDSLIRKKK